VDISSDVELKAGQAAAARMHGPPAELLVCCLRSAGAVCDGMCARMRHVVVATVRGFKCWLRPCGMRHAVCGPRWSQTCMLTPRAVCTGVQGEQVEVYGERGSKVPKITVREVALEVEALLSASFEFTSMLGWQAPDRCATAPALACTRVACAESVSPWRCVWYFCVCSPLSRDACRGRPTLVALAQCIGVPNCRLC
jgi:hypothetical protein